MDTFNREFLAANGIKSKEIKATSDFASSVNQLMFNTSESLLKLKQETNSIKLIAGPKVLKVLQELEDAYEDSLNSSAEMMKDLAKNVVNREINLLNQQKEKTEKSGLKLIKLKDTLFQEIKSELDEI